MLQMTTSVTLSPLRYLNDLARCGWQVDYSLNSSGQSTDPRDKTRKKKNEGIMGVHTLRAHCKPVESLDGGSSGDLRLHLRCYQLTLYEIFVCLRIHSFTTFRTPIGPGLPDRIPAAIYGPE
jgi:hypothetical protein